MLMTIRLLDEPLALFADLGHPVCKVRPLHDLHAIHTVIRQQSQDEWGMWDKSPCMFAWPSRPNTPIQEGGSEHQL
jgi:hypothetical protein